MNIKDIFSDQFVNKTANKENILLISMYRFAYPFSLILNKLNLNPNQVTVASLILTILACTSLIYLSAPLLFSIFWSLAILFDFCDGTLARMTGKLRTSAFRIDHFTDLIKLFLLFVSTGFYFNETNLWALLITALFCYLLFGILQQELDNYSKNQEFSSRGSLPRKSILGSFASNLPSFLKKIFMSTFSIFFTINGHTLLVFIFLPYSLSLTFTLLVYFGLVSLLNLCIVIYKLKNLPR